MPSAKGKKPTVKTTSCPPQEIVVTDCEPDPNPVHISKTCQNGYSDSIFFSTTDTDRVYEVHIKGKVFDSKEVKQAFWCCHPTSVFTVLPGAKLEKFRYDLKAIVGPACAKGRNADPPTIIIED